MIDRTKFVPAIVALFFTFVASVVTVINKYESTQALIIILSVLVGSYVVGLILKWIMITFLVVKVEETPEETEGEEGTEEDAEDEAKASVEEEK